MASTREKASTSQKNSLAYKIAEPEFLSEGLKGLVEVVRLARVQRESS